MIPFLLGSSEGFEDVVVIERDVMTEGSFWDVVQFRAIAYAIMSPIVILTQGIAALGWFCLGLAAVKSGMIYQSDHPLWARARRWCFAPGIVISLVASGLLHFKGLYAAAAVLMLVAPITSLGYLGVIAAISRPPGRIMSRVLAAGGSSLSIYLGQSIILSTLFAGYGLGLWETVPRDLLTLIAIAVTALLIGALTLWHRVFRLGPFEWVLRKITYAGQVSR